MKQLEEFINENKEIKKIKTTNECYSCCDPSYTVGLPVQSTIEITGEEVPEEVPSSEPVNVDPGNLVQSSGRSYEFGTPPEIQIGTIEYKVREDIYNLVKKYKDDKRNKFAFGNIVELKPNERYCVARIYGGLNGTGKWEEYLEDINKLLKDIKKNYHTWVLQILNDCLDDVWTLEIGVRWSEKDVKNFIKSEK